MAVRGRSLTGGSDGPTGSVGRWVAGRLGVVGSWVDRLLGSIGAGARSGAPAVKHRSSR
jgi:hypothetical protein